MSRKRIEPTDEMKMLLRATASDEEAVKYGFSNMVHARTEMAKALAVPLRKGIMPGNIIDGIFEQIKFDYGISIEFPLDFLAPGIEKDFSAFTIPNQGRIPENNVEGDYVTVPTYPVGNSIDWKIQYARDARWDVIGRGMEVLEAGFVKKGNDDGWHTIVATGADRNILVYDSQANSGQFTKRLISLAKTVMRRNGGGNSTSLMRGKLTDLYLSPELMEDMRNWGVDIVDEFTRREIYLAEDDSDSISRIFSVNLHVIDELGEQQEYQNYFLNTLGGAINANDLELLVGLDMRNLDSFLNPIRQEIQVFEDPNLLRQWRQGYFANAEWGFGSLDNRRTILLSA